MQTSLGVGYWASSPVNARVLTRVLSNNTVTVDWLLFGADCLHTPATIRRGGSDVLLRSSLHGHR